MSILIQITSLKLRIKFSFCLTENTVLIHYRDQPVSAVWEHNWELLENLTKHSCTVYWAKCRTSYSYSRWCVQLPLGITWLQYK